MKRTIRNQSDSEQLEYIKQLYNYNVDMKFRLLDLVDDFKKQQKPYDSVFAEVQKLTTEIVRLDEKRNAMSSIK